VWECGTHTWEHCLRLLVEQDIGRADGLPLLRVAPANLRRPRAVPVFDAWSRALQMFQTLYGQTAAALYAKAAGQNAQARQLYNASADTYYKANDAAAYDDWVRARNHWDYFYNRS
jgi:hypothetical protein